MTRRVTGLVIPRPGHAECTEYNVHESPQRPVWVRVELCGVCTPEQRVFRGARGPYPYWGGHELCGLIESSDVDDPRVPPPGTRVAVGLMARCGGCPACRRGLDNHCAYLQPVATDGLPAGPRGFADRVQVAPWQVFDAHGLPAERAALAEPLACCLHSVGRSHPVEQALSVVLGAGTMGILHTVALLHRGCRVILFDDATPATSTRVGPVQVQPIGDAIEAVREASSGWGAEHVFVTRGGAASAELGLELVARGGSLTVFQSQSGSVQIDLERLRSREIALLGSLAQSAADLSAALHLMRSASTPLDALPLAVLGPDAAALAAATARHGSRVLLDFR